MVRQTAGRRARLIALAVSLTSVGVLVPATNALAAVVSAATGGSGVSADLAGTNRFTPLEGPAIAESSPNELTTGSTTILDIPTSFRLNTGSGSVSIGGAGCDMKGQLKVAATKPTFTVTRSSSISGCIV